MTDTQLSVCIVTYRARDYLRDCLASLYANPPAGPFEVIVVDNHSEDGTVEMLKADFPQVSIIETGGNEGFTVPMNRALRRASGRYLLQLNPDTLIHPQALDQLIGFMEAHPGVGICGPKVLNVDGSLQAPCRRGESRPWAVISYFLGLSRLFPHSRLFGEYLMNYMDEDETHAVAGVSGSCMLVRREVLDQVGYLDERFFAYQEDADYCFQARKAGWKIYYVPAARVTHYGGQGGSRVQPYRSIFEWHRSYWRFYRKNFAADYFFLFNWLYYLAMLVKLAVTLMVNLFSKEKYAGRQKPTI
jgi:GT2 family glycosyltransferase